MQNEIKIWITSQFKTKTNPQVRLFLSIGRLTWWPDFDWTMTTVKTSKERLEQDVGVLVTFILPGTKCGIVVTNSSVEVVILLL